MENVEEPKPKVSKLAIAGFLCGFLGLISAITLMCIYGIFAGAILPSLAIILGGMAYYKISQSSKRLRGKGWTISGIVLGGLTLIFIVSVFAPKYRVSNQKANVALAYFCIDIFTTALECYKEDIGHYPSTTVGLKALEVRDPTDDPKNNWKGLYERFQRKNKAGNPIDPWGYEYQYISDGKSFTILSYGADGKPGGTGFKADITKAVTAKEK